VSKQVKSERKQRYFTTPIYYVNDKPHIGHAFTTICADYLSRYYKSMDYDVYFLTGTDEHGKKISDAAEVAGKNPQEFVDSLISYFKDPLDKLAITNDNFIRTTASEHEKLVQEIYQKLYDLGDIYKGTYKGKYCVACEAYYGDDELLENNLCPVHRKPILEMEEESYFFRLSKYEPQLRELFSHDDFILPKAYKNEMLRKMDKGLKDLSVSRKNIFWGIQLPFDKEHVAYVWIDALSNYLSGLKDEKYWPAIHLLGKEILWFHSVYWPAILFAIGKEPPRIFVHGWWTVNGEKMSKTQGNVINIDALIKYGVDPARYFLLRQMSYGEDSDFNSKLFEERYNELLNNVSNLVYRVAKIAEKNKLDLKKRTIDTKVKEQIEKTNKDVFDDLEQFKIQSALAHIMEFASFLNKYTNEHEPWKLVEKDREKAEEILYNLVYGIEFLGLILAPATPYLSSKIKDIFCFKRRTIAEFVAARPENYGPVNPIMLLTKVEMFEFTN